MNKKPILAAALVASAVATGGYAYAGTDTQAADQAEMQAALAAKVSITQAIQTAERQSGGKAMEAAFSDENDKQGYEVTTVAKDGTEQNLFVDAKTGKAVGAAAAANDENGDNGVAENEDGQHDDSEEGE